MEIQIVFNAFDAFLSRKDQLRIQVYRQRFDNYALEFIEMVT